MRLEIEKHVPIAGGMGGGSADAAATLIACDALWGTELRKDDLIALAAKLGADVPFALLGGTAIGTGRGDQLSPALAQGNFHWVLAIAEFGMSTPGVYAELDRHRARHARDIAPATAPRRSTPRCCRRSAPATRACSPRRCTTTCRPPLCSLAPGLGHILELGEAQRRTRRHRLGLRSDGRVPRRRTPTPRSSCRSRSRPPASPPCVPRPVHGARVLHPGRAGVSATAGNQVGPIGWGRYGTPARRRELHLEFPTRVIFDEVTVGLNEGDRVGVVGRNGDGKSTLLACSPAASSPTAAASRAAAACASACSTRPTPSTRP